ncbi:hypothetical protein [Microcystis aeruginosa]|uniref:hypothetical protein n=1 Tax=Microcystis aeruginosa TaxID=1126 RepID=UPI0021AB3E1E|nr:hypothetical protein [Microcystis aeruginosa]
MNAPIITPSRTVESMFPTADQIPEAFRIKTPINQREYLINGELRHWDGEVEEVISPIHIQTDQGLVATKIGHFPLLSKAGVLGSPKRRCYCLQSGSRGVANPVCCPTD